MTLSSYAYLSCAPTRRRLPLTVCLVVLLLAVAPAAWGVDYELTETGTSHVAWTFYEPDWNSSTSSTLHNGDDYYAIDYGWGTTADADRGKMALAVGPGNVIFAGRNPYGEPFDDYGNQVVVQLDDANGAPTEFAVRYAHLESIAVQNGDNVWFGSEIGTVGGTGSSDDTYAPHLHLVLYQRIYETSGSVRSGVENLYYGFSPSGSVSGSATIFAAPFDNQGTPYSQNAENLPCSTWNFNRDACNAHSIRWGGTYTQDCAYYYCSGLCLPRGTSNCRASCESYCNDLGDDSDESLPCHTWNGNKDACDAHGLQPGGTRDCAYYTTSHKCRPRGTANCLANIYAYCG